MHVWLLAEQLKKDHEGAEDQPVMWIQGVRFRVKLPTHFRVFNLRFFYLRTIRKLWYIGLKIELSSAFYHSRGACKGVRLSASSLAIAKNGARETLDSQLQKSLHAGVTQAVCLRRSWAKDRVK